MLMKSAVRAFRKRRLNSFEYLKKLSRVELLHMINELDPKPDFISKDPLWKHQLAAFLITVYIPQVLLYLDMGLGKTRVILEIIAYLKKCGKLRRALITVPNDVAVENWIMEVERHRPDLQCLPLYGGTEERFRLLKEHRDADIYIVPYSGLNWMCCKLEQVKGRKSRKLKINQGRLSLIEASFNFMCLDECTEIMNHRSLTYRVCRQISDLYDYRTGMSGIPVGRDPHSLWSQFEYCDHGETLGETLGLYRAAFFKRKTNYFSGFYDYVFDKRRTKLLHRTMQNRSIYYEEGECRDMPRRVSKPIYVPFTEDTRSYYNSIIRKLKENKGDLRLVRNSFLHMRQIASGFIGLIDDETGDRVQVEFPVNPKIEALVQVIKEIPTKRKFLIFYEYNWTGNRISQELTKLGVKHGRLRGGQKDGPDVLRQFVQKKSLNGLVINNGVGAFSLNLQVANYLIFVESPVSPIVRQQAEKRIHRGGQRRRCFIIDIIMKDNTADESIQSFLREGRNIRRELMRGKAKLKLRKV